MSTGFSPKYTAWVYDEITVSALSVTGRGAICAHAAFKRAIYSGVVPQQPPTTLAPRETSSAISRAKSDAESEYTVAPSLSSGSPAFGLTITGTDATLSMRFTTAVIWLGASEQFMPTALTPSPSAIATAASGEVPVMVLPSAPNTNVAITGRLHASLAASTAALSS